MQSIVRRNDPEIIKEEIVFFFERLIFSVFNRSVFGDFSRPVQTFVTNDGD